MNANIIASLCDGLRLNVRLTTNVLFPVFLNIALPRDNYDSMLMEIIKRAMSLHEVEGVIQHVGVEE